MLEDESATATKATKEETEALAQVNERLRRPVRLKARRIAREMSQRVFSLVNADWGMEIEACHRTGVVEVHGSGHLHAHPTVRCSHGRFCPYCAANDAQRRVKRYLPVVMEAAKSYRLQFVTLTTLSLPDGGLEDADRIFWNAWTKLRRRDVWDAVAGSVMAVETTWSREYGWHLHGHGLVAVSWDENYDYGAIQTAWEELTGASIVNFRTIDMSNAEDLERSIRELLKYPAKLSKSGRPPRQGERLSDVPQGTRLRLPDGTEHLPSEFADGEIPREWLLVRDGLLEWPDDAFEEYADWSHGRRTMRSYGVFYNPPEPVETLADEPMEDPVIATVRWEWQRDTSRRSGETLLVFLIQGDKSTSETRPTISDRALGPPIALADTA
ncbi:MAG: protein rep [Thermaerobacter sp.]|nr:protein rep [Thermaerobacter sp.]